jgi:hypothetical protein
MVVRSADGKNLGRVLGSSEVATPARADEEEPEVRRGVRGDEDEEHAAYRLGGPLAYGDEGGGGLL